MSNEPAKGHRRALCLAVLAALTALLAAGNARAVQSSRPTVKAYLSTGVVRLGDAVRLVVAVEGARGAELGDLPSVDGLDLGPVGSPSRSQSIVTVNGRTSFSEEVTWAIAVRPRRVGEFTLPPFDVKVDGQAVRTAALSLTVVQDLRGEDLGHFELNPSATRVVEGQPFTLELRFGWDAGLDGRVNYANLSLPWWDALPGVIAMDPEPLPAGAVQQQISVNSSERVLVEDLGSQDVHGRAFRTLRLLRTYTATRSGTLSFGESFLEFGRTVDRGFFGSGRTKGESYFVRAPEFEISVMALPEAGRPLDFGGAIGNFDVHVDADPRDVDLGESIKVTLDVTGAGNLQFFQAPDPSRMPGFEGFRYFGKTESKAFDRRSIRYDLAPLASDVATIPPLRLPVFDPEAEAYVVLSTDPIPIRVRENANAVTLSAPEGAKAFARDIADIETQARPGAGLPSPGGAALAGSLAAVPLLWFLGRLGARGDAPQRRARARRKKQARRELAAALARPSSPGERLRALHAWLAARSEESPQAWEGRDVEAWARAHSDRLGWSGASAPELARAIADLEAAAYAPGAAASDGPPERLLALADTLAREGL